MNSLSPWAAAASKLFSDNSQASLFTKKLGNFEFNFYATTDSLWLLVSFPLHGKIAFRLAYSPDSKLAIDSLREKNNKLVVQAKSSIGSFHTEIKFHETSFQYTTKITPKYDLLFPFWPRDIVIPGESANGEIYVSQVGTRSGLIYFSQTEPKAASVLYLQNLTALNAYAQQTETSLGNTVGGNWPELGFTLPPSPEKTHFPQERKSSFRMPSSF